MKCPSQGNRIQGMRLRLHAAIVPGDGGTSGGLHSVGTVCLRERSTVRPSDARYDPCRVRLIFEAPKVKLFACLAHNCDPLVFGHQLDVSRWLRVSIDERHYMPDHRAPSSLCLETSHPRFLDIGEMAQVPAASVKVKTADSALSGRFLYLTMMSRAL